MNKTNKAGWEIVSEEYYEQFKIFSIKKSKRINPRTLLPFEFFLIDGLDWVNIIPVTKDGQIILVRQYRHGAEDYTWEIPGGCVESEESDPSLSAARELREETGYVCEKMTSLGCLRPNPAMLSNRLHVYLGEGAELKAKQILDAGENIEVCTKSVTQVRQMIKSGEINHALVVAAFGLWTT